MQRANDSLGLGKVTVQVFRLRNGGVKEDFRKYI
jgi:hypothetical protein